MTYAPYASFINQEAKFKLNKLYLGNKMSGVPFFNAPWFDAQAARLRALPAVGEVFNPADHDRKMGFEPSLCPNGTPEESRAAGFVVREALAADYAWITAHSDAMIIGPDWRYSPGTISEIAIHQALRLPVWEFGVFIQLWDKDILYDLELPPIMDLGGRLWTRKTRAATVSFATAVVERTDKFGIKLYPVSGAAIWLIAPLDHRGRQECADMHLTLERAEEAAYALLQAVDDARQAELDSENGSQLSALGALEGSAEVHALQAAYSSRHRYLD